MRQNFAFAKIWTDKRWIVPAALCAFAIFVILRWPFSQPRIVQSLKETFPVTVTFQSFRPTYFPHPGCVAEGVSFQRLRRLAPTPPHVNIPKIKKQNQYMDLP